MTKPIIHDGETQREMTDAEYSDYQNLCADLQLRMQHVKVKTQAAESARNKLKNLGLSDAEITALVG